MPCRGVHFQNIILWWKSSYFPALLIMARVCCCQAMSHNWPHREPKSFHNFTRFINVYNGIQIMIDRVDYLVCIITYLASVCGQSVAMVIDFCSYPAKGTRLCVVWSETILIDRLTTLTRHNTNCCCCCCGINNNWSLISLISERSLVLVWSVLMIVGTANFFSSISIQFSAVCLFIDFSSYFVG